jgi:hypothetical protein
MARNRQIGRAEAAARVREPSAGEADAASHDQYHAMLNDELGPRNFHAPQPDDGRAVGIIGLITRPSGLFCLALSVFLIVLGVNLWRNGVFSPLFAPQSVRPEPQMRPMQPTRFAPAPDETARSVAPPAAAPPADTARAESDESPDETEAGPESGPDPDPEPEADSVP